MKLQKDQQFTVYLTPLTPVHIGCAVDYEPTDTLIHEKNLYHLKGLSDWQGAGRGTLSSDLLKAATFENIQKAFAAKADQLKALAPRPVPMSFTGVWSNDNRGKIKTIERTAFNAVTGNPIVTGSALKGAFRTAFIEQYGEQGRFDTDPLRQLKIADSAIKNSVLTAISERRIRHKTTGFKGSNNVKDGSQNYAETVLTAQKEAFICKVSNQHLDRKTPLKPLVFEALLGHVCQHTFDTIQTELQRQRDIDDQFPLKIWWTKHQNTLQALKNQGAALIRLGRHSGSEQLSAASIRRLKSKPGYPNYPITAAFAYDGKNYAPFGFMLLVPCYARAACDPLLDQLLASMGAETAALKAAHTAYAEHQAHCAIEREQWKLDEQAAQQDAADQAQAAQDQAAAVQAALEKAARQSPQQNAIDALAAKAQDQAAVLKGKPLRNSDASYAWFTALVKQAANEGWSEGDKHALAQVVTLHLPSVIQGFLQTDNVGRRALKKLLEPLNLPAAP